MDATFNCQLSWQQEYWILGIKHFSYKNFMQVGNDTSVWQALEEILSRAMSFTFVFISVCGAGVVFWWGGFDAQFFKNLIELLLVGEVLY